MYCVNEISHRQTRFRNFLYPVVFVPGFRTSSCQACISALMRKPRSRDFVECFRDEGLDQMILMSVFGIKMFLAITTANVAVGE